VERVEARGKHLIVRFDDGRALLTHMQMKGSWHVYRPGERWQRAPSAARAVVETDDWVAVCFGAPLVDLLTERGLERHRRVEGLGPDVLAEGFDAREALARLRARGDREVGDALLVQRALAGIGNVYKSEALFLRGIDPFARVGDLGDDALLHLVEEARSLMRRNLGGGPRTTRRALGGARVWVYRRSGRPCYRCGTAIRRRLQGLAARSTYWCPRCQPAGAGGPPTAVSPSARTTP
jgi:endonuclease-8